MSLKSIANALTSKVGLKSLVVQKHTPAILFGAGVVGVVATVVLASRATLKLESVIDLAQADLADVEKAKALEDPRYTETDRQRDMAMIYAKATTKIVRLYAPAVIVGTISIGALTGAHVILNRRNAALTAAYAIVDKGFRAYRERVVGELGEEKDLEFLYGTREREIVEETETGPVVKTIKEIDPQGFSMYARFFDETNVNWNRQQSFNQIFLRCQQNYANDLLKSRGYVFLNDVYDMLGMERTKAGQIVGWVLDGGNSDNYIDFGIFTRGNPHDSMRFVVGEERSIRLDFNVDGNILDLI
jgi:hypothetical protein